MNKQNVVRIVDERKWDDAHQNMIAIAKLHDVSVPHPMTCEGGSYVRSWRIRIGQSLEPAPGDRRVIEMGATFGRIHLPNFIYSILAMFGIIS